MEPGRKLKCLFIFGMCRVHVNISSKGAKNVLLTLVQYYFPIKNVSISDIKIFSQFLYKYFSGNMHHLTKSLVT